MLPFSAGHSWPRFSGSTISYKSLNSSGHFPSFFLLELRLYSCWIDYSALPIHDISFASLHHFSSWTALLSGSLGVCIALWHAVTCTSLRPTAISGSYTKYHMASAVSTAFVVLWFSLVQFALSKLQQVGLWTSLSVTTGAHVTVQCFLRPSLSTQTDLFCTLLLLI